MGSTSLKAIGPGIAEALITTAVGLFAAIPAAIFYNYFGHVIREIGARMDDFAHGVPQHGRAQLRRVADGLLDE